MGDMRIALLGSVFLPPSVLAPLAVELTIAGHEVVVVGGEPGPGPAEVLAGYVCGVGDGVDVLVAHSNAGWYVPELLARGLATSAVFMDAVLPSPEGGALPVVPPQLRDVVPRTLDGERLAAWTAWWPEEVMRAVFPDEQSYRQVLATSPEVPARYVDGVVAIPPAWTDGVTGAFLGFGETYAAEVEVARALGWPVEVLGLGHLGMLADPPQVAAGLGRLLVRVAA